MIDTASSSLQKEGTFKEQHRNSSFKIWWFQLFARVAMFMDESIAINGQKTIAGFYHSIGV